MSTQQPKVELVTTSLDKHGLYTTGIYFDGELVLAVNKTGEATSMTWHCDVRDTLHRLGIEATSLEEVPKTLPSQLSEITAPGFEIDEDDPEAFLFLPESLGDAYGWISKDYAKALKKFLNSKEI